MADEVVKSEENQTASGDETGKEEVVAVEEEKKEEKVEITKVELEALKGADGKKTEEIENLKRTIYTEDYVEFLRGKNKPEAQTQTDDNVEFMSQKDLYQKVMAAQDEKLRRVYLAQAAQNQERTVVQQIKNAQEKYADYEVMRPAMKKLADRIGGNLSADDAYRLAKQEAGQPIQLKKTTVVPKTTEKPGLASSATKKTNFSEAEALDEAAKTSGLDKFLESRIK